MENYIRGLYYISLGQHWLGNCEIWHEFSDGRDPVALCDSNQIIWNAKKKLNLMKEEEEEIEAFLLSYTHRGKTMWDTGKVSHPQASPGTSSVTPWIWTSSLHNCEKINVYFFKPPNFLALSLLCPAVEPKLTNPGRSPKQKWGERWADCSQHLTPNSLIGEAPHPPTTNTKEAEVEWFYEDLQDLL